MEIAQDNNKVTPGLPDPCIGNTEIKEENIKHLKIKDVAEISGLELVKHVQSIAKSSS